MTAGSVVLPQEAGSSGELAGTYRPHLDGLRAIAVYLVVLFHAGSDGFSGGYVGVDVFFVLSGFLVTQLLLRDLARSGSIGFRRFYSRRFRRLLPAVFVTLMVTALVYTAIASPGEVANAVGAFKAAFLYSTNWYFIHQASAYFGADIATSPVLHFWSLAIEEQFYLLWPLALGGAFAATRRMDRAAQLRAIRVVVAVGAIVSMAWALSLRTTDPNRAYYGTDTRAYELLGGALLALVPGFIDGARRFRTAMRVATAASVVVLLVLASSWVDLDAIERGIAVTITTCVLLVAIEAADGGLVKRAVSTRSVVYLGRISYGTYLWHWLVILVVTKAFHLSTIATIGIACLVATSLASLSFEMLEHPVRTSNWLERHRGIVIATGLAVSVVSALVLVPKIVTPANAIAPVVRNSTRAHLTPRPANLDVKGALELPRFNACVRKTDNACTVVDGTRPRMLLIGDSEAGMLRPLFGEIARREGLTFYLTGAGGCPWQRDLYTSYQRGSCKRLKDDLYGRLIAVLDPDVVVVAELDYGSPGTFTGPFIDSNGRRSDFAAVERATTESLAALRAGGRDVMMVESLPIPVDRKDAFDPLACLAKAEFLEDCRYQATTTPTRLERLYRRLAKQDHNVASLDLDRAVCPLLPTCDPVVDGQIVKLDSNHLTARFSRSLAPEVAIYLKSLGFIPR